MERDGHLRRSRCSGIEAVEPAGYGVCDDEVVAVRGEPSEAVGVIVNSSCGRMNERRHGAGGVDFGNGVAVRGDEVGISVFAFGLVLEAADGLAGGGLDGGLEGGHVSYEDDGLVRCVVFDELVGAAEIVSSRDEGFCSAGAEVHVSGVDLVVNSGDMIGWIV